MITLTHQINILKNRLKEDKKSLKSFEPFDDEHSKGVSKMIKGKIQTSEWKIRFITKMIKDQEKRDKTVGNPRKAIEHPGHDEYDAHLGTGMDTGININYCGKSNE